MAAKIGSGARVRIREAPRTRGPFSDVGRYRDLTGEVIGSTTLVAYAVGARFGDSGGETHLLNVYHVRLDTGIEIDYVVEECLELFEDS